LFQLAGLGSAAAVMPQVFASTIYADWGHGPAMNTVGLLREYNDAVIKQIQYPAQPLLDPSNFSERFPHKDWVKT